MLFRRNKRPRPPKPAWLPWLLVGFCVLAALGNARKPAPGSPNPVHDAFQKAMVTLNPHHLFPLEDYKKALFPEQFRLRIKDTAAGSGPAAICGQHARLAYAAFLPDGKAFGKSETDKSLRVGMQEEGVPMAVASGVIGLRAGGKRSIIAPRGFFRDAEQPGSPSVRIELELLALSPPAPDATNSPFRIVDTKPGNGAPIACGSAATLHVTLWDVGGKKLYSTKDEGHAPLQFTPGLSQVFLGLEQGALGMNIQDGGRLLVVPPEFQKTMDGHAPIIDFPFPENQTVLVDIESVP